jgi:hypothetical protein
VAVDLEFEFVVGFVSADGEVEGGPPPGFFASGAGFVKPPVLYKYEAGLITPELPICRIDELEIPSTFKKLI